MRPWADSDSVSANPAASGSRGQQPRRRSPPWIGWLLLVAVVTGGGLWLLQQRQGQAARLRAQLARLETVPVQQADLLTSTEATGVVTARRKVNLSPNVASRIAQLFVREGDRVVGGALIARMEDEGIRARAEQARSHLKATEAESQALAARRRRHEPLLASGAISVDAMEELRNRERQGRIRVDEARFELLAIEADLRNTRVTAPFAGIITRQFAQVGQFVTPTTSASEKDGATSTSIAELSSGLEVVGRVAEANLNAIRPGQRVEIRTDAFADAVFQGRVAMVSPRAVTENQINSFPVSVALESGEARLRPAMTVQLRFLDPPIRQALLVPLAALTSDGAGRRGLLVRQGDGLRFVPVRAGRISQDRLQVLGDVKPGDRVLLSSPPPDLEIPGYSRPR